MGKGVGGKQQVFLDIGHLHREKGWSRELINDKLGGVLEIYEKFMREDPIDNPMRLYPAVHYTMGGLWVDYEKGVDGATLDVNSPRNQQTSIPGLFAAGECEYQYHGANRLGANALLSCLTGGELAALGVQAYLQNALEGSFEDLSSETIHDSLSRRTSQYEALSRSHGSENAYQLLDELQDTMWSYCGIWRLQKELIEARSKLDELTERSHQCCILDSGEWSNQAQPFVRSLQNMIEMSKAIVGGAILRDESRGAHFKLDTPDRDDSKWLVTTKATWNASGPIFDFSEQVETNVISPRPRKYKINQNKVVKEIMGADFLEKAGLS